jgi:hypothetical protein
MKTQHMLSACVLGVSMTLLVLGLLSGPLLAQARVAAAVRYVATTGSDTGSCTTIVGRCRTVQYAVSIANPSDEIWLAGGTYTGTGAAVITITKSITLYGGWDGAALGVRDPQTYLTTVDAQSTRQGMIVSGAITVTLDGFTVTNGVAPIQGAGLYANGAYLTLRNMTFYSNVISTTVTDNAYGGGAMVEGGILRVEACRFSFNSVQSRSGPSGGGIAISGTLQATVENSVFQNNDAWFGSGLVFWGGTAGQTPLVILNSRFLDNGWGNSPGTANGGYAGAIQISSATAQVEDNSFVHNQASNGWGAVSVSYSDLLLARNIISGNASHYDTSGIWLNNVSPFTLTNNLIVGNESTYSWELHQGVDIRGSSGQMLHNTIARNHNTYGIRVWSGVSVALTNTILVSHTVGITVAAGSTATLENTLWGSGAWANGMDWGGAGAIVTGTVNVWSDPRFAADGYHLLSDSAAIDRGVNAGVINDIDGDVRPQGDGYDLGADEYRGWRLYLPLILRQWDL